MALTALQQERIIFHLDFQKGANDILKIGFKVDLDTFNATQERILVGTLANAVATDKVSYDGEELCTNESILGRTERAFNQLTVDTIDPSQFVKKAGKVELNPAEYKLRYRFYRQKVAELERALGYSEGLFAAFSDGTNMSGPRL